MQAPRARPILQTILSLALVVTLGQCIASANSPTLHVSPGATTIAPGQPLSLTITGRDMPAGTERLLSMLENSIAERPGPRVLRFSVRSIDKEGKTLTVDTDQPEDLATDRLKEQTFKALVKGDGEKEKERKDVKITKADPDKKEITVEPALDPSVEGGSFTVELREPATETKQLPGKKTGPK